MSETPHPPISLRLLRAGQAVGPGLVVMLADTDVGSIVTAGQSGMQWGARLLVPLLAMVPLLYMVQELTVRLGIHTGRGFGELLRDTFGRAAAWLAAAGLIVAAIGALLTEFSGVAAIGELYGVPRAVSLALAAGALIAVVLTGSYRRAERVAMALGLFELAFFGVAWAARPDPWVLLQQAADMPLRNGDYLYLVAANIGAVVMPWMVFYQQSATAEKRLRPEHLAAARWETAAGALLTQLIMAAVLVATAATLGTGGTTAGLDSVGAMSAELTLFLGAPVGRLVFGIGVLGAAMVAAIVVTIALGWGLSETAGHQRRGLHAPAFMIPYAAGVVAVAGLVAAVPDLVALNLGVQVVNALLLPGLLVFLIALARRTLPPGAALRGWYFWVLSASAAAASAVGVYGGLVAPLLR